MKQVTTMREQKSDTISQKVVSLYILVNYYYYYFIVNFLQFKMISKKEQDYKDLVIIEEKSSHSDVPIKRYSKGKLLGKGGFAKCFEFTSLDTRKTYAAKVIEKNSLTRSKAKEKLTSEIKIHKSLKFQYIVGFEHFFEDAECVYILLEICPNQTLNELIKRRKRITEVEAQCYLYQIALALKYLHSNRVIHRDLKLGNLFLSEKLEIKIGDFGLAAKLQNQFEKRKTMCGTPNYIAPEILDNKMGHSYEVDVWSFGVIAYAVLVGRPPFQTSDVKTTYNKIRMCNYSFPDSINLSKASKNFISKMLQLEPSKRLTVDEILSHEFFTSNPFPKTLPISTLACPPNANFMKQFQKEITMSTNTLLDQNSKKKMQNTDKINTSRGYEMNTQRICSLQKDKMGVTRTSTQHIAANIPQRAASSTALVGHKIMQKRKKEPEEEILLENEGPEIWVTYHVQNPKFGMCYLLNSNSTGMNFNDSTCLVSNNGFSKVKYFELNQNLEQMNPQVLDVNNSQATLAKKMKIIMHFNQELRSKRDSDQLKMNHQQRIRVQKLKYKKETSENAMAVYVKKYLKASKASIFWFSNKDFQIIFQDSTEILLKNQNTVYVNKYGERKYFLFSEYETMPEEIQKRVKYAIQITRKFRSKQRTPSSGHGNQENKKSVKSTSIIKPPLSVSSQNNHKPESKEKDRGGSKEKREMGRNSSYGRFQIYEPQ